MAGGQLPELSAAVLVGLVGFLSYGVSLVLFVYALRHLGTSTDRRVFFNCAISESYRSASSAARRAGNAAASGRSVDGPVSGCRSADITSTSMCTSRCSMLTRMSTTSITGMSMRPATRQASPILIRTAMSGKSSAIRTARTCITKNKHQRRNGVGARTDQQVGPGRPVGRYPPRCRRCLPSPDWSLRVTEVYRPGPLRIAVGTSSCPVAA